MLQFADQPERRSMNIVSVVPWHSTLELCYSIGASASIMISSVFPT